MNQGIDSRALYSSTAVTGAIKPHITTPLEATKLPMLHCSTKGKNRNSADCEMRNRSKLPLMR